LFMVGVAYQAGGIPLKTASLEQAIRMAGVGVEQGLAAFRWGRMALVDLAFVKEEIAKYAPKLAKPELSAAARKIVDSIGVAGEVKRLAEVRVPELIAYQDHAYAQRYADALRGVVAAEAAVKPGATVLSEAAARNFYKLLAYKDEYEVARLHTLPQIQAELESLFSRGYKVSYNLAPPLLSKRDPVTGHLVKKQYGPWVFNAFKLLAKLKSLRGGALDVFGKTEERRTERALAAEYQALLGELAAKLTVANYASAVALAGLPDEIRGYGHVKENSVAVTARRRAELRASFERPEPALAAE